MTLIQELGHAIAATIFVLQLWLMFWSVVGPKVLMLGDSALILPLNIKGAGETFVSDGYCLALGWHKCYFPIFRTCPNAALVCLQVRAGSFAEDLHTELNIK